MLLISFNEALKDSTKYNKRHLLLGNGFSIACRSDIFVYKRVSASIRVQFHHAPAEQAG